MVKEFLFGKTLSELNTIVIELGMPRFTSNQIAEWLYKKNVASIEEMTNISLKNRELLDEKFEIGKIKSVKVQTSTDGTKKYLFPTLTSNYIEAAYIPETSRATLCVSSQAGCKMGCLFCMTARQGFQGHLSSREILNQLFSIPERDTITNIVYMGMGEPFDNIDEVLRSLEILTSEYGLGMSPKRITVSSIGIIPGMKKFLEESQCHLAISLHTPFDEERLKLMPVQNIYPIASVINEIKHFPIEPQRRISFEYIMFKDLNDTPRHVNELVRMLNGIHCRINLIRFHPIPGTPLESSTEDTIHAFQKSLSKKGILTTIRASRGQDIYAACGLLSTKAFVKPEVSDF